LLAGLTGGALLLRVLITETAPTAVMESGDWASGPDQAGMP
jgi:hypothetical protein